MNNIVIEKENEFIEMKFALAQSYFMLHYLSLLKTYQYNYVIFN